jgi:demethylmenaquinone methyltransferase/2-methoxy-6-polyprenyl-1,4-benzoquinol methylase
MNTLPEHNATRQNYDRMSRWYDWFAGSEQAFTLAGLELLSARPGERILEIGCGTGHALDQLARSGAATFGLDLSAGMLARARRAAKKTKPGTVHLCQADALHLPLPSASLDAVLISFTLELFPEAEIPAVLAECRRTLRPNGRLAIVALADGTGWAVDVYKWTHVRWPEIVDCRPIATGGFLSAAGFRISTNRRMEMWGLPVGIFLAEPA